MSMVGKTVVITGANSGIGLATAQSLAKMGASIIMVCRSKETGESALESIKKASESESVYLYTCDLSSQKQVRTLSDQLHRDLTKIDVLINNAGLISKEWRISEDGFEYQFAVNYLSHFLLTQLVVDLLRASEAARIINVSSAAHKAGKIHYTDLSLEKNYTSFRAYAQSKLANVIFSYGLCSRLFKEGITANAVHPGMVGTRFGTNRNGGSSHWAINIYQKIAKSPEKGAETIVYLASSPEVNQKSGGYYVNKRAVPSSKISYDPDAATALWNLSLKMCGLDKSLI